MMYTEMPEEVITCTHHLFIICCIFYHFLRNGTSYFISKRFYSFFVLLQPQITILGV